MNSKKSIFLIAGIIVVGIIVAGAVIVVRRTHQADTPVVSSIESDPFGHLTIPDMYASDPATKAVIEQKIARVKNAYAAKPNDWQTWIAIGDIHSLLGDYPGAIDAYKHSLAIEKHNIVGYRNIAVVYENNLQDYTKAAETFQLAIANAPGDIENYLELALIQQKRLNHPLDAEKTLQDGLKATNSNPDLWLALVRFYQSTGDTVNYTKEAKALMAAYPKNTQYKSLFTDVK